MFNSHRSGRGGGFEPPIELRFVDLFMILLTGFILITAVLSIISALSGGGRVVNPPRIVTDALPHALQGVPYRVALAAEGGTGGYRWRVKETEQAEIHLDKGSEGFLVGTPATVARSTLEISVVDSSGRSSDPSKLILEVVPASGLTPRESELHTETKILLPDAVDGEPYRYELKGRGGQPPYRWRVGKSGAFPAKLTVSEGGIVSGSPSGVSPNQPYEFALMLTDATGRETTQEARIWILPAPPKWYAKVLSWLVPLFWLWFMWKGGPGLQAIFEEIRARRRAGRYR